MNVIVLGDSIAQGFYDDKNGGWVNLLFTYLQKKTMDSDFEDYNSVFNLSVSGENSRQIVDRFKTEISPRLSDSQDNVIIFAGGINDAKRLKSDDSLYLSFDETKHSVENFIASAKDITDKIFVVGPIRVNEDMTSQFSDAVFLNADIDDREEIIKKVAKEEDVNYISMSDFIFPQHLDDGLHPNSVGHQLMFERIKGVLKAEGIL